ncbi:MAG: ABC transporter ATP-binding protein [Candidatus Hermodarchaeota archaeon]
MVKIRLVDVEKNFGPVQVLKNINLEIKDQEFMVLVGPSGCGKSTCLNIIAGLEYVSGGRVFFDDVDVTFIPPKERMVAMVFQSYALYPHMNVRKNMAFSLKLSKMNKEEINRRVEEAAELLGISQLLDRKPGELSGGQRQRVALGRSIVRNPTVFLFDEPLSNLDAKLRIQMRGEIIKLQRKLKITQIYVTHDQVEAMSMADRIAILNNGSFQQIGPPAEVYDKPANKFVAGFIGSPSMNFFEAEMGASGQNEIIFGAQKYPISSELLRKINKPSSEKVLLGIRPEHITMTPQKRDDSYEVKLTVVEFLGSDTMITFEFPDSIQGMAAVPGFYEGKFDDSAYVSFPMDKIHVFDKETEMNLIHRSYESDSEINLIQKSDEKEPEIKYIKE